MCIRDRYQEMSNRIVKSSIGRITPDFITKLAPICESRKAAVEAVDDQFYPTPKERSGMAQVIRDRTDAVQKVLSFVRNCSAFSEEGADTLKSFSGMVASKSDREEMLAATKTSVERYDEVLRVLSLIHISEPTRPY